MNPKYPEGRNLFQDKNILITAAAGSGIGFSTAKRFLEEGANIFISDVHLGHRNSAANKLLEFYDKNDKFIYYIQTHKFYEYL